ncbi:NUDIX domain-containing protein [Streptomyces venezuelae]|uniref:NUDIX domain-containing protein n=1 Tax=Streptomyces venezuelae TaxID=54571 RepID=UPI00379687A2
MSLFHATADAYGRYRPGLPDEVVLLLAGTLRGIRRPALLDLGTGTGQVPTALLPVLPRRARLDLVDADRDMLDQADRTLRPLLTGRAAAYHPVGAEDFTAPDKEYRADLVTCARAFHWMDRPAVLAMADRVTAPGATLAIMGDGSLWTHPAPWTVALRELIQSYLGTERRAATAGAYAQPRRRYEDDLADSPFSDVEEHHFPIRRVWAPDQVIGYLRSTSFARPDLFGDRHPVRDRGPVPSGTACGNGGRARRGRSVRRPARPSAGRCPMSGGERHTVPVDVHVIAVREGEKGPQVLLSRRSGTVYAAGHWHFPSGHVDGPFEDVVTALVRETYEETGLVVDPDDVRAAVTVHHRAPAGSARVGFFFEVRRWSGTPEVREPAVCDAVDWFAFEALPEPMVAYCRAGLEAYRAGVPVALHFQELGDPIGYDPAVDRLRLVPAPGCAERRLGLR